MLNQNSRTHATVDSFDVTVHAAIAPITSDNNNVYHNISAMYLYGGSMYLCVNYYIAQSTVMR